MQNGETSPISLNTERAIRHLALCGLMGGGKTAVSEIAAPRLGRPRRDNDETLRGLTGLTAAQIEHRYGVVELHRLEATALAHDVGHSTPSVVTAAASVVTDAEVSRLMRESCYIVWLDCEPTVAAQRMLSGSHRPVRDQGTRDLVGWVASLRAERGPAYRALADLVIDTTSTAPSVAADLAIAGFKLALGHEES
jgi:shikimate kinase